MVFPNVFSGFSKTSFSLLLSYPSVIGTEQRNPVDVGKLQHVRVCLFQELVSAWRLHTCPAVEYDRTVGGDSL